MSEPKTRARCPICGKPASVEARPFCSTRCADVDLGRWLTEQYRLPGKLPDLDDYRPPMPDTD
ncbi:MAG: DNA gyrase inhibitor YacG [Acetobacteraceae bacterium]|nr:DNA gyrase inhibitor YacG [Acetobacteraceae bacterium]